MNDNLERKNSQLEARSDEFESKLKLKEQELAETLRRYEKQINGE